MGNGILDRAPDVDETNTHSSSQKTFHIVCRKMAPNSLVDGRKRLVYMNTELRLNKMSFDTNFEITSDNSQQARAED